MHKPANVLTISTFILACSIVAANAQQSPSGPMMQRPAQPTPGAPMMQLPDQSPVVGQQEKEMQEPRTQRGDVEDESDHDMGSRYHHGRGRGAMGPGMMGMMGMGRMAGHDGSGSIAMRIIFGLMDSNGDGTVSLEEFKAAHERIFRAMDANKDGKLSFEEIQDFMRGTRRSLPQR